MPNPIERATDAIHERYPYAERFDPGIMDTYRTVSLAVFESIDPDELAQALRTATDNGADCTEDYAAAVKAWLTGKDQT